MFMQVVIHFSGLMYDLPATTQTDGSETDRVAAVPGLVVPTSRLRSAWLEAHEEWGPGLHEDGFGLSPVDDVDSSTGFAAWVKKLTREPNEITYRWIVDDDQIVGGIALRHPGHHDIPWAGHIGFGVRPSARGRGLATHALLLMLAEAERLGATSVLLVCAVDNAASAKTIERAGGILEGIQATELGPARRYWIRLSASAE